MPQNNNNVGTVNPHIYFGLIVTGDSEKGHLPNLFKSLMSTGCCTFKIIGQVPQRRPITSEQKKLKKIGKGSLIPDRDEDFVKIARRFFQDYPCGFVLLIDDMDGWEERASDVFKRYRLGLNTMLNSEQQQRAAVHFLVNMLEAYYFAEANAINNALKLDPPLTDYAGDVETIPNPKHQLKNLHHEFNEVRDGGEILKKLDVEHVLSRPETCAWLRTLFAWCVKILEDHPYYSLLPDSPSRKYCLAHGTYSPVTQGQ
ncbi:hypothetical protein U14_04398 [Candidatus Moduliflexus flocculans]|uniref:Uncharacterized protein n=1 Tax=Candidatus Moduliflexus flocculans TaxID=1499966 RepID=A0A0S6W3U3_9BACT|nr:hypothetical protein U14_04398 [Candidatus Moduliflexus flocculans]